MGDSISWSLRSRAEGEDHFYELLFIGKTGSKGQSYFGLFPEWRSVPGTFDLMDYRALAPRVDICHKFPAGQFFYSPVISLVAYVFLISVLSLTY